MNGRSSHQHDRPERHDNNGVEGGCAYPVILDAKVPMIAGDGVAPQSPRRHAHDR
jgi:hypothetical protein